jgi:hypothetical protein
VRFIHELTAAKGFLLQIPQAKTDASAGAAGASHSKMEINLTERSTISHIPVCQDGATWRSV